MNCFMDMSIGSDLQSLYKKYSKKCKNQLRKITLKSHRANLLLNIIQNNNPFPGGALGFNLAQIKQLVEFDFANNSNLINYSDNLWENYLSREDFSITKWMTLIDLDVRLPELLLMRMDKLVMQSGVETRVPISRS